MSCEVALLYAKTREQCHKCEHKAGLIGISKSCLLLEVTSAKKRMCYHPICFFKQMQLEENDEMIVKDEKAIKGLDKVQFSDQYMVKMLLHEAISARNKENEDIMDEEEEKDKKEKKQKTAAKRKELEKKREEREKERKRKMPEEKKESSEGDDSLLEEDQSGVSSAKAVKGVKGERRQRRPRAVKKEKDEKGKKKRIDETDSGLAESFGEFRDIEDFGQISK